MANPTDPDPDAPAGEIVFYDADGNVVLVLPAEDVDAIIPDSALRKQPPEDEE
jgi:hypothetical protein